MNEECILCNKECDMTYTSSDDGGYIVFCSLKCAEKYIKDNWNDFVFCEDSEVKGDEF